jgi:hypothetical protein
VFVVGAAEVKMPVDPFQVLSSSAKPVHPSDGRCPVCGNELRKGFAYLSAGALLLSEDMQDSIHTDRLQAFFHVGFHGSDSEMRDSFGVTVVDHLHGGQFDLQWCSVDCMRTWLLKLLAEVEGRVQQRYPPKQE